MCSIGLFLDEKCSTETTFKRLKDFENGDAALLKLRCGCEQIEFICAGHEKKLLRIYAITQKICCDPFESHGSMKKRKALREITMDYVDKHYDIVNLVPGKKICTDCRIKLTLQWEENECKLNKVPADTIGDMTSKEDTFIPPFEEADNLNKVATLVGESPIDINKLKGKGYPKRKFRKIKSSLAKKLRMISPESSGMHEYSSTDTEEEEEERNSTSDYRTIISQLKAKYLDCDKKTKIQILSVLPKNWTTKRVVKEFGALQHLVKKTKKLVLEQGILPSINPHPGKPISKTSVKLVHDFYENMEISREMPGMKDVKSVVENGVRVQRQKRLILANLKEIYRAFKDKNPDVRIGFSKFAELRPKHCVLPGASGTHSVCVCTIHQNIKLMIQGAKLPFLSVDETKRFETYHHILAQIMCNPPLPDCHLGKCTACPGTETLKEDLLTLFDNKCVESISYKQWLTTDRCNLETFEKPVDDFIDCFVEKVEVLRTHDFIAKQQAAYMKELKTNLQAGEVIVSGDFAENYSFVLQDAAQGFHWNNSQATLHPFVCYYLGSDKSTLEHSSYVFISDCLTHDTVAVHSFQKNLIPLLKEKCVLLNKVIYFSDGAASQYKNKKNFINLCEHKNDFDVPAEWHFFATSHGKGPCDGVGGTVKRLAARASLQKPYESQIMTPKDLYNWARENLESTTFKFIPSEEIETNRISLNERFQLLKPIVGTRNYHSFVATSTNTLRVKQFSFSEFFEDVEIKPPNKDIAFDDIKDYVTIHYGGQWWLGYVLEKLVDANEIRVRFLHPHGPSPSFVYPPRDDELTLPLADVLTIPRVELGGRGGRTYIIKPEDVILATQQLFNVFNC